jgi:predicted RNA methylase/Fe-S-cluster containining protein
MENVFWSGADMVFWCLIDKKRTNHISRVIKRVIKKGDIVIDAGAGTGIFSIVAAKAGAKKVYAVEYDKNLWDTLDKNFQQNGYKNKIKLVKQNAKSVHFKEKADIIICEMISTGLIDEFQVPAMNNLSKFLKRKGKIIPAVINCYADLVYSQSTFYKCKLEVIRYEYSWHPELKAESYTEKRMYRSVDFSKSNRTDIEADLIFTAKRNGKINGIRISNESLFPDGSKFTSSEAYCMPLILPTEEMSIKKGDNFKLKLAYKMCGGLKTLKYELEKIEKSNFLTCIRCNKKAVCCKTVPPMIFDFEREQFKKDVFVEKFDNKKIYLLKKIGKSCKFLQNNRCQTYDSRPFNCRMFPLDLKNIKGSLYWIVWEYCSVPKNFNSEIDRLEKDFLSKVKRKEIEMYVKYTSQAEEFKKLNWKLIRPVKKLLRQKVTLR